MNDVFDTEAFLRTSAEAAKEENFLIIVERLCKKIDVVKRVYCFYSKDILRKQTDKEIEGESYTLLLNLLTSLAKEFSDYKYLNSALKLNDILSEKGVLESSEGRSQIDKLEEIMKSIYDNKIGAEF